jgi:enoyl-CoA hydratase/carnithine racemase
MTWQHVDLEVADGVATVTLKRPERLNALTFESYADLRDLFGALPLRGDVRAVVLTGRGRGFCAGGDVEEIIGELTRMETARLLEFTRMTGALVRTLRECPLPIIAAVNGIAAGAGAVIALACDFRLLARSASFAFLFTQVGLTGADMGAAYLLPRLIGLGRATELLMLGERVDAEHAREIGLATRVVEDDALAEAAAGLARRRARLRLRQHEGHADPRAGPRPGRRARDGRAGPVAADDGERLPRLLRRLERGAGAMSGHEIISSPELAPPVGFAHAVRAAPGRTVWLGGQIAADSDGAIAGATLPSQFDRAAANLLTALRAAGGEPEHIVSLQVFVTDVAAYRAALGELGVIWRARFGRHYPAMGLFGVTELFDPAALVELMGVAVVPA